MTIIPPPGGDGPNPADGPPHPPDGPDTSGEPEVEAPAEGDDEA